jgi:hypothetical protein
MLIPSAIRVLDELISEEKPSISQYIDVNFGLENLPLSSEILKKFSDA